jgi:hypothetical protein
MTNPSSNYERQKIADFYWASIYWTPKLKNYGVQKIILFFIINFSAKFVPPFDSTALGGSTTPPPPTYAFDPDSIMCAVKPVRARRSRG